MDTEQKQPPRREYPVLREMTYNLIRRHPEIFKDVPSLQNILLVLDTENEPKSKGRPLLARLSKISGRVVDFVYDGEREFMLEWFQQNTGSLTLNQSYLLLAQQLMRFETDGSGGHRLTGWDIEEMEIVADRFGFGWTSEKRGDVDNILDPDFRWGRSGQARINFVQMMEEIER